MHWFEQIYGRQFKLIGNFPQMLTRIFSSFQKGMYPGDAIDTFESTNTTRFLRGDIYGQTFPRFLEPGGGGGGWQCRGEEYLVRCYTARGQWYIINRIWFTCMILYAVYTIDYTHTMYLVKFQINYTLFKIGPVCHPPPPYKINTQQIRLIEVLGTSTQSQHLWTVPWNYRTASLYDVCKQSIFYIPYQIPDTSLFRLAQYCFSKYVRE